MCLNLCASCPDAFLFYQDNNKWDFCNESIFGGGTWNASQPLTDMLDRWLRGHFQYNMITPQSSESLLAPYRVLDLTDGGYMLAARILGDLGADVIKIEPLGGSLSRFNGPFFGDMPNPQQSIYWFSYNSNKRSVTLDIETSFGRDAFLNLVSTADFVFESYHPGYLDGLGLGFEALSKINPGIIFTSITPFGATGPYARYKASDLTIWAMGGFLGTTGEGDRPPVSIAFPQACQHAAGYAAVSSMIAHWHREMTGQGQHVQVSARECIIIALYMLPRAWEFRKLPQVRRPGSSAQYPVTLPVVRYVYSCKDGDIFLIPQGGASVIHHTSSQNLVKFMADCSMASDWLLKFDWVYDYDASSIQQETLDRIYAEISAFFITKTKEELYEQALKRRILLAPIADAADVYRNDQLRSRDFWTEVYHPELGKEITYCAPFVKLSTAPIKIRRRPPLIGEHNSEIMSEINSRTKQKASPNPAVTVSRPALEGIKIADFSWSIVGPITAKHIADHGATVVRVESHTRPETQRVGGPFKDDIPHIERSSLFPMYNTSKYGMSLNLNRPRAQEVALRLINWADVVIESFTPGVMKRWGLDYKTISKQKPSIIYASTCLYGQYGPTALSPGYGQMATALAGISSMVGWPDRSTSANSIPHTDFISPQFLVPTIISALDYRRRTGKGLYIDQSQVEAGVHFCAVPVMDFALNGRVMKRVGNRHPLAAPHGAYPCLGEDRWCTITVFKEEEWCDFTRAIGNPAWTRDPRFTRLADRKENEDELDCLVGAWTSGLTSYEVMDRLQAQGVPAGVVAITRDLHEDVQIQHSGFWRYIDHPVIGVHAHQGPPFRLTKTPDRQFTSPCLGEHNEFVYREILGYSDEDISNLMVEGVITTEADIPEFKASF